MNSKLRFKMGLALVVSISLFWVSFMPLSYNGVYYQPSKNHTFKRSKWHFITLTQCSFVSYTYIYQMVFSSFMIYWVTWLVRQFEYRTRIQIPLWIPSIQQTTQHVRNSNGRDLFCFDNGWQNGHHFVQFSNYKKWSWLATLSIFQSAGPLENGAKWLQSSFWTIRKQTSKNSVFQCVRYSSPHCSFNYSNTGRVSYLDPKCTIVSEL